ncbi:2-hydroxychromene-2-carboxylate isomerase [Rhodobacteraceae bacterium MBR-64]
MARIDCFFTILSPWVYIAGTRLEDIAARHGAEVQYRPLDAGALLARTGGLPLGQRHENRQAYRLQDMRRQAKKQALPINLHPAHWPTNAAPASYAIIAAQAAGGGNVGALVHALARASWAGEKDIADEAVIRACLSGAGFDPELVNSGLLIGAETYAANLEEAQQRGAFGSPYYVVEDERFWGQDRLEDLDLYLAGKL